MEKGSKTNPSTPVIVGATIKKQQKQKFMINDAILPDRSDFLFLPRSNVLLKQI